MTAKEKARELIDKFRPHAHLWDCYNDTPCEDDHPKKCALIALMRFYGCSRTY